MSKVVKNSTGIAKSIKFILYLIVGVAASLLLLFTSFNIVYMQVPVVGYSMMPTINATVPSETEEGDTVIVNRLLQGSVGDIVVANTDWSGGSEIAVIKRLIAVEGDAVRFEKSITGDVELYINNILQIEDYISSSSVQVYDQWCEFVVFNTDLINNEGNYIIPEDCVYLLGDNRDGSLDCSKMGAISKYSIIGKVELIISYGDNIALEIVNYVLNLIRIT